MLLFCRRNPDTLLLLQSVSGGTGTAGVSRSGNWLTSLSYCYISYIVYATNSKQYNEQLIEP